MSKDVVEITKEEYEELVNNTRFLNALDAAGVDNWTGYGEAWEIYEEDE